MNGLIYGVTTMMRLGGFSFGIMTAAYQRLQRTTTYRYAKQERFGQHSAIQYTGPGEDTMTLEGVIYPSFRGGMGQVSRLRALAATGQPQIMIDGLGNYLGRWVIESVGEGQGTFAAFGIARKQEFTVQLRYYGDGIGI